MNLWIVLKLLDYLLTELGNVTVWSTFDGEISGERWRDPYPKPM